MAGRTLGAGPRFVLLLQLAFIAAGAGAVWWAFESDDLTLRLWTLVVGCLFASPHVHALRLRDGGAGANDGPAKRHGPRGSWFQFHCLRFTAYHPASVDGEPARGTYSADTGC